MAIFAIAIPVLPGKEDELGRFTEQLRGSRHREFADSRKRLGVHERTFLQHTPMGSMVIVTLEGDDPAAAFAGFSRGTDPFTKWFGEQVKDIHGIDLSAPPPGPLPELIADSR